MSIVEAIAGYEESLAHYMSSSDDAGRARCLAGLASAFFKLGRHAEALSKAREALEINRLLGNRTEAASCYEIIGSIHVELGQFRQAIENHRLALQLEIDIGDKRGEAVCYINLGVAYRGLGALSSALECDNRALTIYQAIPDPLGEASCHTNIGITYRQSGQLAKATKHHAQAGQIYADHGNTNGLSKCRINMGVVLHEAGQLDEAIESYEQALGLKKKLQDIIGEAMCYVNLALSFAANGQPKKALTYSDKALRIYESASFLDAQRIVLNNKARIFGDQLGDDDAAYACCVQSLEIADTIRRDFVKDAYKVSFSASTASTYEYVIRLCLRQSRDEGVEEAFGFVQRAKSQALLDILSTTETHPTAPVTSKLTKLLQDEQAELDRLRLSQMDLETQPKPGEVEGIRQRLADTYKSLEAIDAEYVQLRRGRPLTAKTAQQLIREQPGAGLVEYFVADDAIYVFVVSPHEERVTCERMALSRNWLRESMVEAYEGEVVGHLTTGKKSKEWQQLGERLVAPLVDRLERLERLYVVPHDELHRLPIHALFVNGMPLAEQLPVIYASSSAVLKFCMNKATGQLASCAAFGVSHSCEQPEDALEEKLFREEAQEVAAALNGCYSVGAVVTKQRVIEALARKDIVHLSCHGIFDKDSPLGSGILLYDGILSAQELATAKIKSELVVMSACQTGLSKRSAADELIGLTRCLLYAGATSVVVSLWSVEASSTKLFMRAFYEHLVAYRDKAAALQHAQRVVRNDKRFGHEYFWAPFVLVGHGGRVAAR